MAAVIWRKPFSRADPDNLNADVLPVYANEYEMQRIPPSIRRRPREMLDLELLWRSIEEIVAQVRLARVRVRGCAAAAGHDFVEAVHTQRIPIPLYPVLEQMVVPRQKQPNVMLTKEGQIKSSKGFGRRLDQGASVRPR